MSRHAPQRALCAWNLLSGGGPSYCMRMRGDAWARSFSSMMH